MLMATIPDSDLKEVEEVDLSTEEGINKLKMLANNIKE